MKVVHLFLVVSENSKIKCRVPNFFEIIFEFFCSLNSYYQRVLAHKKTGRGKWGRGAKKIKKRQILEEINNLPYIYVRILVGWSNPLS